MSRSSCDSIRQSSGRRQKERGPKAPVNLSEAVGGTHFSTIAVGVFIGDEGEFGVHFDALAHIGAHADLTGQLSVGAFAIFSDESRTSLDVVTAFSPRSPS